MHEGSTNTRLKQELRSATDLALWAREVTAQSLAKAMSTLVVQERRLWLSHAERSDVDKVSFLDALVSQAGLFGDTVEDCAQQFLGSTEADRGYPTHLAPAWCTAPPQSKPQSARRRGCPIMSSRALLRPVLNHRPARRASHRSAAPSVFQLAPISSREAIKRPWHRQPGDVGSCSISGDGEDSATLSPEWGQGENHLILFRPAVPTLLKKEQFPFLRVFRLAGWQCATHCLLTLARDPSCQRPRECGWGTQGLPTRL